MDWIDVCWESQNNEEVTPFLNLPARVMMILDFDSAEYATIPHTVLSLFNQPHIILDRRLHEPRNGIHLMIHSSNAPAYNEGNKFNEVILLSNVSSRYTMEPVYQLVKLENIKDIAFVAMDPPDELVHCRRINILINDMVFNVTRVSKPVSWGLCFEEKFSRQYCPPNDNELDSDEFNEIFHPW